MKETTENAVIKGVLRDKKGCEGCGEMDCSVLLDC